MLPEVKVDVVGVVAVAVAFDNSLLLLVVVVVVVVVAAAASDVDAARAVMDDAVKSSAPWCLKMPGVQHQHPWMQRTTA